MPAYPIEWAPPALLGGYPNMARRDSVVWEAYLRSGPPGLLRVAYNVALGGVVPNDPTASPEMLQGWAYSSGAKVDALLDFGDHWWVAEVKPSATLGAVGQALGYVLLAELEGLTDLPMIPTIITDSVSPYMLKVCEELDLNLVLLPQPVPTLADLPYPVGSGEKAEESNELPNIPNPRP
jgi:hypothetical protein